MKRVDFLKTLRSPTPSLVLKKWPEGNIMQYWAESPELYSRFFGHADDFHKYIGGHSGIDIAGPHRTPIVAAHDGTVFTIMTDRAAVGGLTVYVDSPDLDHEAPQNSRVRTAYGHLDEIVVNIGQQVKRGDLLGYMGNTGFVVSGGTPYWGNAPAGKGTHLHYSMYEYMKNAFGNWIPRHPNVLMNSVDPLPWITDPNPEDGKVEGDLSGIAILLRNAARYIQSRIARR